MTARFILSAGSRDGTGLYEDSAGEGNPAEEARKYAQEIVEADPEADWTDWYVTAADAETHTEIVTVPVQTTIPAPSDHSVCSGSARAGTTLNKDRPTGAKHHE